MSGGHFKAAGTRGGGIYILQWLGIVGSHHLSNALLSQDALTLLTLDGLLVRSPEGCFKKVCLFKKLESLGVFFFSALMEWGPGRARKNNAVSGPHRLGQELFLPPGACPHVHFLLERL